VVKSVVVEVLPPYIQRAREMSTSVGTRWRNTRSYLRHKLDHGRNDRIDLKAD